MKAFRPILATLCAAGPAFAAPAESASPAAAAAPVEAVEREEGGGPSGEVSLDFSTRQVTYGLIDNNDPIITVGGSLEWKGFTFEAAAIYDVTRWGEKHGEYGNRRWNYQEITFGPGYTHTFEKGEIGLPTDLEVGMNYIYEYHPRVNKRRYGGGLDSNPDTQFLNAWAGLPSIPLEPAVSFEFDLDNEPGAMYGLLELGHTFALIGGEEDPALDFGLTLGLGFGNAKRNRYDAEWDKWGFKDVNLTGALTWHVSEHFELSPYVTVYEQLQSDLRDAAAESNVHRGKHAFAVGGIVLTASF